MSMFLYGAAVQGIQDFIFQTNELKDIVGASELVEEICTEAFEKLFKEHGVPFKKENSIVQAAGNIVYKIDEDENNSDLEKFKQIIKHFPKSVMGKSVGITISQTLVPYKVGDFQTAMFDLQSQLKSQRNKPFRNLNLGLIGIERSRTTGFPAVVKIGDEYLDEATKQKHDISIDGNKSVFSKFFGESYFSELKRTNRINDIKQIENICVDNDWIAIIHIDGNSLGKILHEPIIANDEEKYRDFSRKLNKLTRETASETFVDMHLEGELSNQEMFSIPFRPIILGGDDLTLISRGDLAISYVRSFFEKFEHNTETKLGRKLTACAGIAFVKKKYPFYYGYDLAEALCRFAKEDSGSIDKKTKPSCLMFHKVQDSFTEEYEDIIERELSPQDNVSFCFGPYYLHSQKDRWTIDSLVNHMNTLEGDVNDDSQNEFNKSFDAKEGSAIKSHLRQWMSIIGENEELANNKMNRMISWQPKWEKYIRKMIDGDIKRDGKWLYPVYDVLSLYSVTYQKTN